MTKPSRRGTFLLRAHGAFYGFPCAYHNDVNDAYGYPHGAPSYAQQHV